LATNEKVFEHCAYRIAICLLLPFSQAVVIRGMLLGAPGPGWLVVAAIIALLLSLGMWFNLCMFPWRYSVFGSLRRAQPPSRVPVESHQAIGTQFNKLRVPLVAWSFFPGGAEISTIIGRVWLPREMVVEVQNRPHYVTIFHSCAEVRSPITAFVLGRAEDRKLVACLLGTFAPGLGGETRAGTKGEITGGAIERDRGN